MAHYVGIKQALGTFHDGSGYLACGLSLAGLLAAWALLQPRGRGDTPAMKCPAVPVLLAATAACVVLHPPPDLAVGHGALASCPDVFGGWNGVDRSFKETALEELKADGMLVRRYVPRGRGGLAHYRPQPGPPLRCARSPGVL
jgi:hypothetical protein